MSRKMMKLSVLCASLTLAAAMAGCGTSNKEGAISLESVAKVDESACGQCHSTAIDSVAGTQIYSAYLASKHFTNNGSVVGCQDCHGGGSQHNGIGPLPYPDPDAAGKCFECHESQFLGENERGGVPTAAQTAHFYNITGAGTHPAMYVTKNYEKSCTSCHDPHKADQGITQEHTDWANSGHGDVNGLAWANRNFKTSVSCIRCHTTTGYIDYVTSGFTAPTVSWATAGDNGREVATCEVCHTDYNFKNRVREVGAFTAPYKMNFKTTGFTYPDVGASNICIPCHSGRESGESVRSIANFTNASFSNPHYLDAAGVFFGVGGFHYYSSHAKYNNGYNTGGQDTATTRAATWNHGRVGINDFNGSGNDGQCVGCHLGNGGTFANADSHTFSPINVAHSTGATGCYGCHDEDGEIEALIEEEKEIFDRAMSFFEYNLGLRGMFYDGAHHPYWVKTAGADASVSANQLKNWTYAATIPVGPENGSGANNMGAAFNFKILNAEKGSHVHNRAYTRWLIFDSVQYLQQGAVTYSNRSIPSTGQANINNVISFTSYSTAITPGGGGAPTDGNPVSISDLKGYLVRSQDNLFFRR